MRRVEVQSCQFPSCDKCGCSIDPDKEFIFCSDCEQKHPAELQYLFEFYEVGFNLSCPSKGCNNHMTKSPEGKFLHCENCKRIIPLNYEVSP